MNQKLEQPLPGAPLPLFLVGGTRHLPGLLPDRSISGAHKALHPPALARLDREAEVTSERNPLVLLFILHPQLRPGLHRNHQHLVWVAPIQTQYKTHKSSQHKLSSPFPFYLKMTQEHPHQLPAPSFCVTQCTWSLTANEG